MKNKLFLLIVLFFMLLTINNSFSNENNKTSIKATLTKKVKKINALNQKSEDVLYSNPTQALKYAERALELSKHIHYSNGIIISLKNAGHTYFVKGNFNEALNYYEKSLNLSKETKNYLEFARNNVNIANISRVTGNYNEATQRYFDALNIFTVLKNDYGIAICKMNLGVLSAILGDNEKALEFFDHSLDFFNKTNEKKRIQLIYLNYGNTLFQMQSFDESLEYYKKAVAMAEETQDLFCSAITYNNIGRLYSKLEDYENAKYAINKSLEIRYIINDKHGIANTLLQLATLYNNTHQYEKALQNITNALELSREVGALDVEANSLKTMSSAFKGLNNYKDALETYISFSELNDSIKNIEKLKLLSDLSTNYENEKKDKDIELLNKENEQQKLIIEKELAKKTIIIISASSLGIFLIAFFILLNMISRHKQNAAMSKTLQEQQNEKFRAVIEAQENERKRIAQDLHDSLGQMLSTLKLNIASIKDDVSFGHAEDEKIFLTALFLIDNSCKELRNISHNIMPSALIRLGFIKALEELILNINSVTKTKINLHVNSTDVELSEYVEIAVYRIMQEVLNNILKHSEATKVKINIKFSQENLHIMINENGKGFDVKSIDKSTGIGWKSIQSRTAMLRGQIIIVSNMEKGTNIDINIPV